MPERSDKEISADVAIIGYGPVGAALANALGRHGLSVVVLEREETAYSLPRAVHIDDECMRFLQAIDLADTFEPTCHVNPGMLFVDAGGTLLADWSRPQETGPLGWHASYRFHQPDLETILRKGLTRYPTVRIIEGKTVTGLNQSDKGVALDAAPTAEGDPVRVSARYAIGCDGARSITRSAIGPDFVDFGFNERWLVVDVLLHTDLPRLGDHTIQHCDPDAPATYVRGTGLRRRWEFRLKPDADPAIEQEPERVWARLGRWLAPDDGRLERAAVYTFRSRTATRWRAGRILIAGDAAHETPPFMGQGLCAGLRDVANLAWKLTLVLQGKAPDALLDSYGSERQPHVARYIDMAVALGRLINKTAMDKVIDPKRLESGEAQIISSIRPPLGPGLGRGDHPAIGRPAPQVRLADGTGSDVLFANRFAVYSDPHHVPACSMANRNRTAGMDTLPVRIEHPVLSTWLADQGIVAALVRPDGMVMDVAASPETVADILARLGQHVSLPGDLERLLAGMPKHSR
ncbi:MAG: bifunctional 3-(3-hydroxy-phenyl)propionate/3-hydroxycinnamic acid hydroxylase [Pseudomonadota bacterium]